MFAAWPLPLLDVFRRAINHEVVEVVRTRPMPTPERLKPRRSESSGTGMILKA